MIMTCAVGNETSMNNPTHNLKADEVKRSSDLLEEVRRTGCELRHHNGEWWGCCPLHEDGTPSFSVNSEAGVWHCFGCGKGGDVIAFAMEYHHKTFPDALKLLSGERMGSATPTRHQTAPDDQENCKTLCRQDEERKLRIFRWQLAGVRSFAGSPAESYLRGRGITALFPTVCQVKFGPAWYGLPAVVFPIRDQAEKLVAAEGRAINGAYSDNPKDTKRTAGEKKRGVFATVNAFDQEDIIIVEGPINALTLAQAGFPAVATCGSGNLAPWLPAVCTGKRRVIIGFDNDDGGRNGLKRLATMIYRATAIEPLELPITADGWDWNDVLMRCGYTAMCAALRAILN